MIKIFGSLKILASEVINLKVPRKKFKILLSIQIVN